MVRGRGRGRERRGGEKTGIDKWQINIILECVTFYYILILYSILHLVNSQTNHI